MSIPWLCLSPYTRHSFSVPLDLQAEPDNSPSITWFMSLKTLSWVCSHTRMVRIGHLTGEQIPPAWAQAHNEQPQTSWLPQL